MVMHFVRKKNKNEVLFRFVWVDINISNPSFVPPRTVIASEAQSDPAALPDGEAISL